MIDLMRKRSRGKKDSERNARQFLLSVAPEASASRARAQERERERERERKEEKRVRIIRSFVPAFTTETIREMMIIRGR